MKKGSHAIEPYIFNKKECSECHILFIPNSGADKYCNNCDLNNVGLKKWKNTYNQKRKQKRIEIQNFWGRNGRKTWKESEKLAIKILEKEGFINIESLVDVYPNGFFDIKAIDFDGKICLFQVTTRTHTGIKRQRKFANILGINNFYILFIKTNLKGYILRKVSDTCNNYSIDNLNEVKMT